MFMGMVEFIDSSKDMTTKKIQDLEVINIGYEDCPPGYGYGPTLRPYHLIHFVTDGEGKLEIRKKEYKVQAGDAFFIPAEQIAYYESSVTHPWTYSWIGFTGTQAKNIAREILIFSEGKYVLRDLDVEKYRRVLKRGAELEEVSMASRYLGNGILSYAVGLLIEEFKNKGYSRQEFMLADEVKFYLDSKFSENIQMREIASSFHIHPNYMNQIFREKYGISPKKYLMDLKIDKAKNMLAVTELPILLIAASLGFTDQLSFSRTFKGRVGVSPTEYRKKSKDKLPVFPKGYE